MTRRFLLHGAVLLSSCLAFFSLALSEPHKFPDRQSFAGISAISVKMLSYENMDEISLTPSDLIRHIETTLQKAGISVNNINRLPGNESKKRKRADKRSSEIPILGIHMKRTEDSALFGATTIGIVTVTLRLYQQVTIAHNRHSTQAITWSDSLSVSGGSKRPKKIFDALDKLLDMFARDFAQKHALSK